MLSVHNLYVFFARLGAYNGVMSTQQPQVTIYTDGGAKPNPGPGGWGALLIYGQHRKELSGSEPQTTNNRMELLAAIHALESLTQPCAVEFYTDSQYLKRGITEWLPRWQRNNWQTTNRQPVKNQELWQRLQAAAAPHDIRWRWTRGHAGDELNEHVDRLATAARRRLGRG